MEETTKPRHTETTSKKSEVDDNIGVLNVTKDDSNMTKYSKNTDDTKEKGKLKLNCNSEEELKAQLDTLMNSLATLSVEKSRMEAIFQADRKQLRSERDEYEKIIKDLKDKLKRTQHATHSEVEHIKYKLIMERHERDKNYANNTAMIKELQKLVTEERRAKESLDQQLREIKSQIVNKTQNKTLEAELEIANNKLKQAEAVVNEAPSMLISLQTEIATLRKQHRNAIHEERKRATIAEQKAKTLEGAHETRVAGLEARLAEFSEMIGGYDRLRQQDQHAIQKLKEQISVLQKYEHRENNDINYTQDPIKIAAKMEELYAKLIDINDKKNCALNVRELCKRLKFHDVDQEGEYKEKYDSLLQEFENYKQEMTIKMEAISKNFQIENKEVDKSTELQLMKSHCRNLEERIQMLHKEVTETETKLNMKLEQQSQLFQKEKKTFEHMLLQKDTEFRGKIGALEHQLLRQRERSLALIKEKNSEITTLRSSFRSLVMKNDFASHTISDNLPITTDKEIGSSMDSDNSLLTVSNPPLLHYAQELARREIQVTRLRKQNSELENTVRENQRDLLAINQRHMDEIKELEAKITRLEAYKSREGANLEYLKNVLVNYLTSNDLSNKRHMLNAIATVLRFTHEEMEMIQRMK